MLPDVPSALNATPPTTDPGIPSTSSTASFWHSQPSPFLHNHRTTHDVPTDADIVIIGSGISGAMAARYLYESCSSPPPKIVMLEARQACWGATGRNGGHCKPNLYNLSNLSDLASYLGMEQLTKLITFQQLNLSLVKEYVSAEGVDCDFRMTPSCDAYFSEDTFKLARESIAVLKKRLPHHATKLRVVTRDTHEGRRILTHETRTPTAVGAVLFEAGSLWPYKLVAYILEKVITEGGMNLQTLTPALSVAGNTVGSKRKWTVITARGNVNTDKVIFATNAHTSHLLPALRGHIYPVRGQMSALVPPKSMRDRQLTHTYALVGKESKMDQYLIQRPLNKDGTGGELMLGGGRFLAAGWGEGVLDGGIDEPVARFLRSGPARFFAGESGFPGDAAVGTLEKSLVSRFRRLTIDAVINNQLRFWDAAEGVGLGDEDSNSNSDSDSEYGDDNSQSVTQDSQGDRECIAKYEWTGVMGFSKDGRPWVGRVPALTVDEARQRGVEGRDAVVDTDGLWMLAGFEGHGMAYCTGSAKALVQMINSSSSKTKTHEKRQHNVYEYFPECLEASRQRLGLAPFEPEEELDDDVDEEVEVEVDTVDGKVDGKWEDDESGWVVV